MNQSVKSIKKENGALTVLIVFLIILAFGLLAWYAYLIFRPGYAPLGATTEYEGEETSVVGTQYRNDEIEEKLVLKGGRSQYRAYDSLFSAHTEYHYEVLLSVPEDISYFTITKLTIRLSYGNETAYDASSSTSEGARLVSGDKYVYTELGYVDFTFTADLSKLTSAYASIDTDNIGKPITEPYPGNVTKLSILEGSSVTAFSSPTPSSNTSA